MTLEDLLLADQTDIADPIQMFADSGFRWGDCEAIKYDPVRQDLFPQPFLFHLYERCRTSGRGKLGVLPVLFCGMTNLSVDAICQYLSQRPICVVGEWRKHTWVTAPEPDKVDTPYFHDLGFCFPCTVTGSKLSTKDNPQNSSMAGYTLFQDAWGTPQQTVCMFLGLAWLFHTLQLACIHGQRYTDNHLTAKFTHKFGFKDCGTASHMLLKEPDGPLYPMTLSTLLRADFVDLTRGVLLNLRREASEGSAHGRVGEIDRIEHSA